MEPLSRRQALRLLAGGALGAVLAACGTSAKPARAPAPSSERALDAERVVLPRVAVPPPAPTPRPVPPRGRSERMLLPGTQWATPLVTTHSGVEGARVMVLGGVHGNEPGGWLAAEEIARWEVVAGSLLVVPRANALATHAFERTLPGLGDLNRLYPGRADSLLPMSKMAAAIVAVAREFEVDLLLDLHESWGFYAEHEGRGTAFLGQTVMKGSGPLEFAEVRAIVAAVNEQITAREQLVVRDRFRFFRRRGTVSVPTDPALVDLVELSAASAWRGSSSLSLGSHVDGLTPVLIEMGQQAQPEERRATLHELLVRTTLERLGMLWRSSASAAGEVLKAERRTPGSTSSPSAGGFEPGSARPEPVEGPAAGFLHHPARSRRSAGAPPEKR